MGQRLTEHEQQLYLGRVKTILDEQVRCQRVLTYLELADRVAMPGPQRIHRLTRLLEKLMKEDMEAGRPMRAVLVVSRVGRGLPAEGFFARARCLGALTDEDPVAFHRRHVAELFGCSSHAKTPDCMDQKDGSLER